MTRFWLSLLLSSALSTSSAFAGQTPAQSLVRARALEREGRPQDAITLAHSLLDQSSLPEFDAATAWNILGLAYEDEEDFDAARHAYEQAIPLLENRPAHAVDYADVLSNLGDLYRDMGQFASATRLRARALHIYEEREVHAAIAVACGNLAGIELSQAHVRKAGKYLSRARAEMKAAPSLDLDDRATIDSMVGWKAELDGDPSTALSSYQSALGIWTTLHGEDHPYSGWAHMLVGKAYQDTGDLQRAQDQMLKGLAILKRTTGPETLRFSTAQLMYSHLLDQTGEHSQALALKQTAQGEINRLNAERCVQCTVSVRAYQ